MFYLLMLVEPDQLNLAFNDWNGCLRAEWDPGGTKYVMKKFDRAKRAAGEQNK
jgi:hypothetical protein